MNKTLAPFNDLNAEVFKGLKVLMSATYFEMHLKSG